MRCRYFEHHAGQWIENHASYVIIYIPGLQSASSSAKREQWRDCLLSFAAKRWEDVGMQRGKTQDRGR